MLGDDAREICTARVCVAQHGQGPTGWQIRGANTYGLVDEVMTRVKRVCHLDS